MSQLESILENLKEAMGGDVWSHTDPIEASYVLLTSYGSVKAAAQEAFAREAAAWGDNDFSRAVFWGCVLDIITPFNLPFKH